MNALNYRDARGWLRSDEREALSRASKSVAPDQMIINIGVEYGASMVCLASNYTGQLLVGVDVSLRKLPQEVKDGLAGKANWLLGDSHDEEVLKWIKRMLDNENAQVGLVFVDGDHEELGVLEDANIYAPLVRQGGLLIFHDCYDFDHPETGQPNPHALGVNLAVIGWMGLNGHEWEDLGRIGTMRIFERRA